jgi:hypothetical protein
LSKAIKIGILDAPQLRNNKFARGEIQTRIVNGACVSVRPNGKVLAEKYRLEDLLRQAKGAKK